MMDGERQSHAYEKAKTGVEARRKWVLFQKVKKRGKVEWQTAR